MTISYEEPRQPRAGVGDLISVTGYKGRIYRVDSVNYELYRDAEFEFDGIFYEATDVQTLEFILADDEDVTVISYAETAKKYLQLNIRKPSPRAPQPTIDDLLLDLSDALALRERFGDHEDEERKDRKYALKVCEIKAQLRERVELGKWR